jgi:cytochrome c
MAIRQLLWTFAFLAGGSASAQEDLLSAGEKVFEKCHTCHLVGPPTKFMKSSPNLNGLFGRRPGGLPGYTKYSDAMIAFGEDKVWEEATLTVFLRDPQGVVKGTRMAFLGLRDDEDIKAVIAYLATFDPDGTAPE